MMSQQKDFERSDDGKETVSKVVYTNREFGKESVSKSVHHEAGSLRTAPVNKSAKVPFYIVEQPVSQETFGKRTEQSDIILDTKIARKSINKKETTQILGKRNEYFTTERESSVDQRTLEQYHRSVTQLSQFDGQSQQTIRVQDIENVDKAYASSQYLQTEEPSNSKKEFIRMMSNCQDQMTENQTERKNLTSNMGSVEQLSTSMLLTEAAERDLAIIAEKSGIFVSLSDCVEEDDFSGQNLKVELKQVSNFVARSQDGCLAAQMAILGDQNTPEESLSKDKNEAEVQNIYIFQDAQSMEVSDKTEEKNSFLLQQKSADQVALKNDPLNAFSSNDSYKTRSAFEKGNLMQNCTDDVFSEQDSQQSSAVSQYFVGEDQEEKDSILKKFYNSNVNADLIHLSPDAAHPYQLAQIYTSAELKECSKESSSRSEHSRSNKIFVDEDSSTGTALKSTYPPLLEKTPNFNNSQIIIEQTNEESIIDQQQVPNYESDTYSAVKRIHTIESALVSPSNQQVDNEEQKVQERMTKYDRGYPNASLEYDLQRTSQIFPGSDGFQQDILQNSLEGISYEDRASLDKNYCAYQVGVDEPIKIISGSSALGPHEATLRRSVQEEEEKLNYIQQNQESTESLKQVKKNRYKNSLSIRESSRFSKGHQIELDRVADRINNSFLLNSQSNCDENSPILPDFRQSELGIAKAHRPSLATSELPKSEMRNHSIGKARTKSLMKNEMSNNAILFIQEQGTPPSIGQSGYQSKRETPYRKEPSFPEPVEKIRQRFSTPRQDGSFSPISKKSTISGKASHLARKQQPSYPVEIRKHRVIRGPVLKSHYERATIESEKLKAQVRRKTREKLTSETSALEDQSALISSGESQQKRVKAKYNAREPRMHRKRDTIESQGLPEESFILPKTRIKQKIFKDTLKPQKKSSVSRPLPKTRVPANGNLLNSRKDVRKKNSRATEMSPTNNMATNIRGLFKRSSTKPSFDKRPPSITEKQNLSANSEISNRFKNAKSDIQFDKKSTPRYPQGGTIDTSSYEMQESINRTYARISKQAIDNLPVEQLYEIMSKNWTKEKIQFDQKCQKVLLDSQIEAAAQPVMTYDQVKTRQQRFDLLKQRLLQNSQIRMNRRTSEKESLSREQENLNQNIRKLESAIVQQHLSEPQMMNRGAAKPVQFGQFQFIFNKPDEFFNPSSPILTSNQKKHKSAYRSQNQIKQQNITNLSNIESTKKQQSQVLSPKLGTNSFYDSKYAVKSVVNVRVSLIVNLGPFIAMNITPTSEPSSFYHTQFNSNVFSDRKKLNSMNVTVVNCASNKRQGANEYGEAVKPVQYTRAATANNQNRRPEPGLIDTFNSSNGFLSNYTMNRGAKNIQVNGDKVREGALSPSTKEEQQRLMQKLQYRSNRGRRIKDLLAQVQSQNIFQSKRDNSQGVQNERQQIKIESQNSDQTIIRPQVTSQSSLNLVDRPSDNYCVPQKTVSHPKIISSKGISSDDGSLEVLESRNENSWLPGQKMGSIRSNIMISQLPMTQSAVLNKFLAQQDKRIDFGLCQLFQKVKDGNSLEIEAEVKGTKFLKMAELESLMSFVKRKSLQTLTRPFQLKAHQDVFDTIKSLLTEVGMGYRADRMQRDESQVNIERVYVMACRAHKLHRARIDLISIFEQIIMFEEKLPKLKQLIMSNLTGSRMISSNGTEDLRKIQTDQIRGATLDMTAQYLLQKHSQELKMILSQLILNIPSLLQTFKFFNGSFVFHDKDYLKYLSKEANEVKGLLSVYNLRF